jgi:hypothetical protein
LWTKKNWQLYCPDHKTKPYLFFIKLRKMTIISCKIILCKMKYFFLILTLSVNKMHLLLRIHNIEMLNWWTKSIFLDRVMSCDQGSVSSSALASLVVNLWINNCRRILHIFSIIVHRFSRIVLRIFHEF